MFPYTQTDYLCPGGVFYEVQIKLLNIISITCSSRFRLLDYAILWHVPEVQC